MPKTKKLNYLKIGLHGNITAEHAREIAFGWAADVMRGIDPKEARSKHSEKEQKGITFDQFFEIFTERHRKIYNKPTTLN